MNFIAHGPDTSHLIGKLSTRWADALCTRPMEPELSQLAKDAQVENPIADLQTLSAYAPLNKARLAYQAGKYQESINQAKIALSVKSDLAPAYWAMGISYGQLNQWDMAITNLEEALKIDKNYGDAKDGLKWAKAGQKAAEKGNAPKAKSPQWN
jgi:tetratricopeptide (TPR) repeat protein